MTHRQRRDMRALAAPRNRTARRALARLVAQADRAARQRAPSRITQWIK